MLGRLTYHKKNPNDDFGAYHLIFLAIWLSSHFWTKKKNPVRWVRWAPGAGAALPTAWFKGWNLHLRIATYRLGEELLKVGFDFGKQFQARILRSCAAVLGARSQRLQELQQAEDDSRIKDGRDGGVKSIDDYVAFRNRTRGHTTSAGGRRMGGARDARRQRCDRNGRR